MRHPRKKIKFFCETHAEFLCSSCVIAHTGAGHIISEFTIDAEQMRADFEDLRLKLDTLAKEAGKNKEAHEQGEKRLIEHYNV